MMSGLHDYTNVETIYRVEALSRRNMRTGLVRRRNAFLGPKNGAELQTVTTPADVHAIFRAIYAGLDDDQEHFVMLVVNGAGQVEGYKRIEEGAQEHMQVRCKRVFRSALLLGALCIAIAHNRPSGSLVPSAGDIELTRALVMTGKLLDLLLLDHCILGRHTDYLSLYEKYPHLFGASGDEPGGER